MSLIKQLWIGIILLLLLALGGSFAISFLSAKHYLEDQLRLKNIDNANTLALSLSQIEKDPVTIELLITAQFDAGHYEYIIFNDPQQKPIVARSFEANTTPDVPTWFSRQVKLQVAPGIAQVQDGWQQYGTLIVSSHSGYAIEALWKNAKNLLDWFLIATLLGGLLGSFVLKYISRPLDLVINQAEAIGERRFIVSNEPRTREFQRLVRAMNTLSASVKIMLEKEAQQLNILRRESQLDPLTGIYNREHFLNVLDTRLQTDDGLGQGVIALARVRELNELNTHLGRQQTDELLCQIAAVLTQFATEFPESALGRLNGSDFALLLPSELASDAIATELAQKLNFELIALGQEQLALPLAICQYQHGQKRGHLLQQLDGALAKAELKGNRAMVLSDTGEQSPPSLDRWRELIQNALHNRRFTLGQYPVQRQDGQLLHMDAPLRLQLDGELKPAGFFIAWASRLGLLPAIDLAALQAGLQQLQQTPSVPLAINISAESLCNARFREQALQLIHASKPLAKLLWLDFPEVCALRHMDELKAFCTQLKALGCLPGLEHAGLEFTQFQQLQDLGLSHLKIDAALVRDIHKTPANQPFLQSLCRIGHSLGIVMIAEGVNQVEEQQQLEKLGLDAITGPGVR
ncbi:bifunctional diguanylate cyclase/phosphodiesterase [Cellvibrio japonicus]|uniref:EAL domain protein n=1 Tax=Cellvibrio japonicus (strain Ueda107) TaxID=498211 RepID=B3PD33_CELJU|nr:EAL domain-containing protein [Cellvibrio japonicus]ACE84007.1 EAL domain protein [Cellvibrio japonicus Ueda107]QEI11968.1 EAL domain-containing protein [Cellvibrio japonicus]QEI15542.1 EAL domain-containing protein [Cellvibrio japonicus]QEI19121.1 EAL domain-containing protein [Cellvibrio japonicus]